MTCNFCNGRGCIACPGESTKIKQPVFVAQLANPGDMELLNNAVGAEAISKAFGPQGGGQNEIYRNLAIASVIQELRIRTTHAVWEIGEKSESELMTELGPDIAPKLFSQKE